MNAKTPHPAAPGASVAVREAGAVFPVLNGGGLPTIVGDAPVLGEAESIVLYDLSADVLEAALALLDALVVVVVVGVVVMVTI